MNEKVYSFAGVNGAGKSTLYQSSHYQTDFPRVITDEILREFGDWRNPADLMKAGKIAVQRLNDYLQTEISFNQETTLCGHTIIKNIKKAKAQGYLIEMHYVGLDSSETAKLRIAERVKMGGHGIPDQDVEKPYKESMENLGKVIHLCDLAAIYDNTKEFRRFAIFKNGHLVVLSKNVPAWYEKVRILQNK